MTSEPQPPGRLILDRSPLLGYAVLLRESAFWQRRTRRFDLAAAAVAGLIHDAAVLTGEGP
ncbi:hypothetical protein PSH03_003717 [Micromonospora sp. PSH03]|uniref:hypothetical protein n=1 Tax=Micromonospora TaxID=1873 RepID=UPI001B3715E5|nr:MULTISPECIES: hypothetical protein [Micromonospora]MBQ0990010.1 hypothetical protein [Micromonospora sp. H61]MCG5454558.1 hypothetical protein [Micromonospora salmantinae]